MIRPEYISLTKAIQLFDNWRRDNHEKIMKKLPLNEREAESFEDGDDIAYHYKKPKWANFLFILDESNKFKDKKINGFLNNELEVAEELRLYKSSVSEEIIIPQVIDYFTKKDHLVNVYGYKKGQMEQYRNNEFLYSCMIPIPTITKILSTYYDKIMGNINNSPLTLDGNLMFANSYDYEEAFMPENINYDVIRSNTSYEILYENISIKYEELVNYLNHAIREG